MQHVTLNDGMNSLQKRKLKCYKYRQDCLLFWSTATCNLCSHSGCCGWQTICSWELVVTHYWLADNGAKQWCTLPGSFLSSRTEKSCKLPVNLYTNYKCFFFLLWLVHYSRELDSISFTVQARAKTHKNQFSRRGQKLQSTNTLWLYLDRFSGICTFTHKYLYTNVFCF